MTPQERISAFFTHSQLLTRLFEAGEAYRKRNISRKILLNSDKERGEQWGHSSQLVYYQ